VTVKQIECVCGYVVKGEDDDELWKKAQEPRVRGVPDTSMGDLRSGHPDLQGKVLRKDTLARARNLAPRRDTPCSS
jgi:hypothetical protein